MPTLIDTVAWVHLEGGRILCARPRGKNVFYVPGGKREGAEKRREENKNAFFASFLRAFAFS